MTVISRQVFPHAYPYTNSDDVASLAPCYVMPYAMEAHDFEWSGSEDQSDKEKGSS